MTPSPSSPARRPTQAREIWLVDKAPVVIEKLKAAVQKLDDFMKSQGLDCTPGSRAQSQGRRRPRRLHQPLQGSAAAQDPARPVHRPHRREQEQPSSRSCPRTSFNAFRGVYLETAQRLQEQQRQAGDDKPSPDVDQLDFEFVLFASAVIDYDYIMGLIARFSAAGAGQAEDEPRAADRPDPVRCQVHGRARGHRRLHRHAQGGRRPERKGHPRRLPALQGREERRRNSPPSPASTAWPPPRCKPSWTASCTA